MATLTQRSIITQKNGTVDSTQIINQYKTTNTVSSVLNSNITYSEPLSKRTALLINYGFAVDNSTLDRQSFDQSAPGVYNVLNSAYSNNYKFNQLTNQVGTMLNYKYQKRYSILAPRYRLWILNR